MNGVVATVKIKTPDSQITVSIPVVESHQVHYNAELLSFHVLPDYLLQTIAFLKDLVRPDSVDTDRIVQARQKLEIWFNNQFNGKYKDHKLRHIIPRSTRPKLSPNENTTRKSFSIQRPVQRFHTDSEHTAFTNLWLPMADITDYPLGFLFHPQCGLVTASKLQDISTASAKGDSITKQHRSFFKTCQILYKPNMKLGDAIVFRSGGAQGVLHGSLRLRGKDNGHRESVEFRCQKFLNKDWVYGEG